MNVSRSRNGLVRLGKETLTDFLVEAHNASEDIELVNQFAPDRASDLTLTHHINNCSGKLVISCPCT